MMHYIHNGHVRVLSYLSVVQFSMSETAPASRERLTILPQRFPFVKTSSSTLAETTPPLLLVEINRTYGTTILLVTHNAAIRQMAHKVLTIRDGVIVDEYENASPVPAAELEEL